MNNDNYENQAGALSVVNARIEALENLRDVYYGIIINDANRRTVFASVMTVISIIHIESLKYIDFH